MTEFEVRTKFGAPAMMNGPGHNPDQEGTKAELSRQALDIAQGLSLQVIAPALISSLVRLFEFCVVLASGAATYWAFVAPDIGYDVSHAVPLIAGPLVAVVFIQTTDGYNPGNFRSGLSQICRLVAAWTMVFVTFALFVFLVKQGEFHVRSWFMAWYATGLAILVPARLALSKAVRRWSREGRLQRRAVIVGGGSNAADLIRSIETSVDTDIRICGIFDDRAGDRSPQIVQGYPRLGTIAELVEFGRIAKVDMLIVSLPLTAENRLLQILKQLWVLPVDIRLSAHADKLKFRPRSYSYIGSIPFLDVIEKPLADWDTIAKRAFDIVFASAAIVLTIPLLIATAIAIKLDSPGPVLFRQKRYGFNNEVVDVLKFRSMYADQCDYESLKAVTVGDRRVSDVGRLIRKTSIDELPQLFNVLKGSLSLVGPRPHAIGSNTEDRLWEAVVDGYFARHKVKPGVTGWAQVNGWRGEVDTSEKIQQRVAHDLYYIENWSPLLDLYILARTPIALLNTRNAY